MEVLVGDARNSMTHLMLHISMAKHASCMKKAIAATAGFEDIKPCKI